MGVLTNLQRAFAYALKPSQFVAWIDAISVALDAGGSGSLPNNGSFDTATNTAGIYRVADITVAQLSSLKAGSLIWVQSFRSHFTWQPGSTKTANGTTVLNPTANAANPGRFLRDTSDSFEWYQAVDWTMNVDDLNGNDENDASATTTTPGTLIGPVKTHAEIARRLGSVITPSAILTVQQIGDAVTQNAKYGPILNNAGGSFVLKAVLPAPSFTGTISAKTDQVPTATPATTTLNAAVSTWTPATEIGRLVFNSTNQGYAFADTDLGAGNLQLSAWAPASILTTNTSAWNAFNSSVNDTVSTYVLPQIGGVEIWAPANHTATTTTDVNIVANFNILGTVGLTRLQGLNTIQAVNCQFSASQTSLINGSVRLVNCQHLGGGTPVGNDSISVTFILAGRVRSVGWTISRNSYLQMSQDVLINNTAFTLSNGSFSGILGAIWIRTANPLTVTNGAGLRVDAPSTNGGGLLSSTSVAANANTGVGITFRRTARLALQTGGRITLTGANDFSVGGNTTALAFDPALALYNATPRACTWALLTTTFVGGGFESCLTDPRSGCTLAVAA